MITLPSNHPQRFVLSNEVHARPSERMSPPLRLSCIALKADGPYREEDRAIVAELTEQYGATPPGPGIKHYSVDLGDFRMIWERHTEFTRYTFIVAADADPFLATALEAVPEAWLATLPGTLIAGAHAELREKPEGDLDLDEIAKKHFSGHFLIGSDIADGAGTALTDFRIHQDGFTRFLILDAGMSPTQSGQIVQRILEIETYRIMALLGLPVAQALTPAIGEWERELAEITNEMTGPGESGAIDEPVLLDRLTTLQAAIEKSYTENQFRFGASAAYYGIVCGRIEDLRESRLADLQTFEEFTQRRLAPAMATCQAAERRQAALSERVDRAAQLLSTRVDFSLEQQNAAVLESMNRRVELQLRLQQTVEGLSIAAITYYVVGVIGYLAKGLKAGGLAVNPELVMGIAVPVVIGLTAFGVWRTRRQIESSRKGEDAS